jgi:hypothetical protein
MLQQMGFSVRHIEKYGSFMTSPTDSNYNAGRTPSVLALKKAE